MKNYLIVAAVSAALFFGYASANGQAAQHAQESPMAPGVTSHLEDPTANDPAQPVQTEQPTAGHDEVSGKDEISTDGNQATKTTEKHPDFASLDQNDHGYLTLDDVKYNTWLKANFVRCDTNHDGHLSQQEYANCK
jgi:hypothetical protein